MVRPRKMTYFQLKQINLEDWRELEAAAAMLTNILKKDSSPWPNYSQNTRRTAKKVMRKAKRIRKLQLIICLCNSNKPQLGESNNYKNNRKSFSALHLRKSEKLADPLRAH